MRLFLFFLLKPRFSQAEKWETILLLVPENGEGVGGWFNLCL